MNITDRRGFLCYDLVLTNHMCAFVYCRCEHHAEHFTFRNVWGKCRSLDQSKSQGHRDLDLEVHGSGLTTAKQRNTCLILNTTGQSIDNYGRRTTMAFNITSFPFNKKENNRNVLFSFGGYNFEECFLWITVINKNAARVSGSQNR